MGSSHNDLRIPYTPQPSMRTHPKPHLNRYSILGVEFDAITVPQLLRMFEYAISTNQSNFIIGNHNIHSIYLFRLENKMREFYDLEGITYVDSMPLIFLGKLLGLPLQRTHRTTFLDWYQDFLCLAEAKDWRIFYVGGRQESIDKASAWLQLHYPRLSVCLHHGFFKDLEDPDLYQRIRDYKPHIVLVGMGMPRQEQWILAACKHLRTNAIVNGGAMIEYMIGEQLATPRWLGQLGLEWLFRLITQPRRLGRRYLFEPFALLPSLVRDFVTAWLGTGLHCQPRRPRERQ